MLCSFKGVRGLGESLLIRIGTVSRVFLDRSLSRFPGTGFSKEVKQVYKSFSLKYGCGTFECEINRFAQFSLDHPCLDYEGSSEREGEIKNN